MKTNNQAVICRNPTRTNFEKARQSIASKAVCPTVSVGDTYLTAKEVALFCGIDVSYVYHKRRALGLQTVKDNNTKGNTDYGDKRISRKIPASLLPYFMREQGMHKALKKHIDKCVRELLPTLNFVEENA